MGEELRRVMGGMGGRRESSRSLSSECEVRVVLVELPRGAAYKCGMRLGGSSLGRLSMLLVKQGFEDKP